MPLNINGTTGISGVDGSVSAPALTGTDSNTGITFPSADTIKLSTGGVERMSITNSGVSGTGLGKIGQVLQTVKTDTFSKNQSSYADITGMNVDITPVATSSKVLVLVDLKIGSDHGDSDYNIKIVRGSTDIYIGDSASSRRSSSFGVARFFGAGTDGGSALQQVSLNFLDSPNTTSATTYKLQIINVGGRTNFVNRTGTDTDAQNFPRTASSITVLEVLA